MAEDTQPQVKKKSLVSLLIGVGIVVMAAAVAALLVYMFVLRPMLAEAEIEPVEPPIPMEGVMVSFEQDVATVIMPSAEMIASLLLYQVDLECKNQATADLVGRYKPRFNRIITEQHRFRTREELNDKLVAESIRKQILLQCNEVLTQLIGGTPDPLIRVTEVFHSKWVVQDQ